MTTLLLHRLSPRAALPASPAEREFRYLWVELLLNPALAAQLYRDSPALQEPFSRAATWYVAYKGYLNSLGLFNDTIEKVVAEGLVRPGPLDRREYNQHYRELLKGLQVLWEEKDKRNSNGSRNFSPPATNR
ncbi:MAG: hypothetical protein AABY65_02360 [Nitrospirota bacterium]